MTWACPYLVTEYIEAGDLRRRMIQGQAMPRCQVRSIVQQIGDALAHLHSKGILHRDLKPENVLMPTDSLVKVGDFGIAVMQDKAGVLTQTVCGMGTVGYVSPEQQYGLKIDERTDQYSLAAVSYELMTGRRPLGSFPPPSQLNPQLNRQVDRVVLRGLAEEPKERFQTVSEFVAALDQALAGTPTKSRLVPVAVLSLIGFLVVGAGVAWVVRPGSKRNVALKENRPRVETVASPPAVNRVQPKDASKPPEPPAKAPERSAKFQQLVELRAYVIWVEHGRPMGRAGDAVREANWLAAETEILRKVKDRAYRIWVQQGCPKAEAGEAVREKNMRAAEAELLKDTLEEMRKNPVD